ncbi:hypothetical protein I4U23_017758 [Adineta vaga]|nr:hypothetical protein I4U23_017758 [Adineta vaga]
MPRKKQVTFQNSIQGKFIPRSSSASVFPMGAHDNRYNAKIAQFLASSSSSSALTDENKIVSTESSQENSQLSSNDLSSIHSNLFHRRVVTMIETLRKPNHNLSSSHVEHKSQPITFGQLRQATILEEKSISHQLPINFEGKQQKTLASFVRDNTSDLSVVETVKSSVKFETDEPRLHYSPSLEKLFEEQNAISQMKKEQNSSLVNDDVHYSTEQVPNSFRSNSTSSFYIHSSVPRWDLSQSNQQITSPPLLINEQNRNRPPPPSYSSSIANHRSITLSASHRSQSLARPPISSSRSHHSYSQPSTEPFTSISLPCMSTSTNPIRSPPPQYQSSISTISSTNNLPPPSPSTISNTNSLAGFDREFSRLLYGKDSNKTRRKRQKRKAYSDPVKECVEEAGRSFEKHRRRVTTHLNKTDSAEDDDDHHDRIEPNRSLNLNYELNFLPRRRNRRQANFLKKILIPANPLLKQRIPSFLRVYSQASSYNDILLQWHLFHISELELFYAMMIRLYKNENLARVQLYEIYRTALLSALAEKTSSNTDNETRALTTLLKI